MNNIEHLFTCKECGSHDLRVEWNNETTTDYIETLYCDCEERGGGIAAEHFYSVVMWYQGWGFLEEDHRWSCEEEDSEELDTVEHDLEVDCYDCYENADAHEWEITHSEIVEDEVEFFVRCDGCNREIEFGWSHPNRGGRIWPAECTDFNPWRCWPEPRFEEAWAEKNWLRPVRKR